jgi:hypothetical protein
MKRGRVSQTSAAVHALSTIVSTVGLEPPRRYGSLCNTKFASYDGEGRPNGWAYTDEPVTCLRCLDRLERLAEQALYDERAIAAMADVAVHKPGGGSHPRPAEPDLVRAFRRTWPAMGRAVADLLRHRGVALGEGWLGPTRVVKEEAR